MTQELFVKVNAVHLCKTSSLFNKEVLCVFLTCCTMRKQTCIHFVQTVIICTFVLPYSVPNDAIRENLHFLKKYFVV